MQGILPNVPCTLKTESFQGSAPKYLILAKLVQRMNCAEQQSPAAAVPGRREEAGTGVTLGGASWSIESRTEESGASWLTHTILQPTVSSSAERIKSPNHFSPTWYCEVLSVDDIIFNVIQVIILFLIVAMQIFQVRHRRHAPSPVLRLGAGRDGHQRLCLSVFLPKPAAESPRAELGQCTRHAGVLH